MAVALFEYLEELHNLRPSEMAEKLGISRALYHQWRHGIADLRSWQLMVISQEFGISWGKIFNLLSEQFPPQKLKEMMQTYFPMKGLPIPRRDSEVEDLLARLEKFANQKF